jgi:hypothetical protein
LQRISAIICIALDAAMGVDNQKKVRVIHRVPPAKYEKYNRDGAWSFKYADYHHTATRTSAVNRYPR